MTLTQARRERERAARQELIVDQARILLARDGFQGLNLDEVAKAIEYSKGTIYLHFHTKEDLALAVATRALKERADLFERADRFNGKPRERLRAVGMACCQFAVEHPDYFHLEMTLGSPSFRERVSQGQRQRHRLQAERCFRVVESIVHDGLFEGDLQSDAPQKIAAAILSLALASHVAVSRPEVFSASYRANALEAVRDPLDWFCEGLGWKPLAVEWDYGATDRRIREEVFPEARWLAGEVTTPKEAIAL